MENICTQTLSSGVDRYRDYIMKSLSKGVCRSDILRGMREQGLICGNTAAYDYMNKLAAFYGIELIPMQSCSPANTDANEPFARRIQTSKTVYLNQGNGRLNQAKQRQAIQYNWIKPH